jgi:hypothetical protein
MCCQYTVQFSMNLLRSTQQSNQRRSISAHFPTKVVVVFLMWILTLVRCNTFCLCVAMHSQKCQLRVRTDISILVMYGYEIEEKL